MTGVKPLTIVDLGRFTEDVILPGVERIVEEKLSPLHDEMQAGFAEMRKGFAEVHGSIRVLAGEIAELKVREEDQKHEERIRRVEVKLGVHARHRENEPRS